MLSTIANAPPPAEHVALTRLSLPGIAGERLARSHPDHGVYRCANVALGLGIVLPLLATAMPFSQAPLALRIRITTQEIKRGWHLLVLHKGRPAAYAGWTMVTEDQGRRFIGPEGTRSLQPEVPGADCIAFLSYIGLTRADNAVLLLALRGLHAGTRYFGRRSHEVAGPRPSIRITQSQGVLRPVLPLTKDEP